MKGTQEIVLTTAEEIKRFHAITCKYAFDVNVKRGNYLIDAKSLLGLFSLNLSHGATISTCSNVYEYRPYFIELEENGFITTLS